MTLSDFIAEWNDVDVLAVIKVKEFIKKILKAQNPDGFVHVEFIKHEAGSKLTPKN